MAEIETDLANRKFHICSTFWNQESSSASLHDFLLAARVTSADTTPMRRWTRCSVSGPKSSPTLPPSTPLESRCRAENSLYCRSPMESLGRESCDDQCSSELAIFGTPLELCFKYGFYGSFQVGGQHARKRSSGSADSDVPRTGSPQ